jgi:WD40 repeat protein
MNDIVRIWDLEKEQSHPRSLPDNIDTAVKNGSQAILSAMEDWPEDSTLSSELEKRIKPILLAVQNELEIKEGRAYRGRLLGFGTDGFSHDGTYMLFEEKREEVAVLDVKSARVRCRLVGHTDAIMWVGSSPDDTLIGTSSWDQTVRLWDAETGKHLCTLVGAQGQSWAGTFSPDGKLIAAGCGDQRVRVWAVESGELLHTFEGYTDWIRSLAFSPDNQKLAAGASGGTLRVFDLATGACLQHWKTQFDDRFGGGFIEVTNALYTSRGLLVFKLTDGRVFTYDEKTNQKGQYEHDAQTEGAPGWGPFSLSRDGARLFASCFDGTVRAWPL